MTGRWSILSVLVATLCSAATATASSAVPAPSDAGDAIVVQPNNVNRGLVQGGSSTPFSLRLPDDAACPGDTRNDQWAFDSFMVPASDDPGSAEFTLAGPSGINQFALYEVSSRPLTDNVIEPNDVAGQPGRLPPIPPLSFAVFPPGTVVEGEYRIGIVCTYLRSPSAFWDALIVVESDARDEPAGFTWRVESASPESVGESSSASIAVVALGAGFLAIGVAFVAVRRRSRSQTLLKENFL